MASAEREPIMGIWARSPSGGPGGRAPGGAPWGSAECLCYLRVQRKPQICPITDIGQSFNHSDSKKPPCHTAAPKRGKPRKRGALSKSGLSPLPKVGPVSSCGSEIWP